MASPVQGQIRNRLLAALPPEEFDLVRGRLRLVELGRADVLVRPGEPIEHLHFMERGITSIIATAGTDARIEVGIVGRDGAVGAALALGVDRIPHEALVQAEGAALRLDAGEVAETLQRAPALRDLLLRFTHAFHIQAASTALANGSRSLEERLARWILMCHDRLDGDEVPTTHEFLSTMLSVRRPGVTVALHMLEGGGMIQARRGRVTVLDRSRLERTARGAYGIPEAEYRRLIGPL
jgi:CRP-like cAMP-binding protein